MSDWSEDKPQDEQSFYQGAAARRLLEDDAFDQAFRSVREAIRDAWEECPPGDTEAQMQLKYALYALGKVREQLLETAERGVAAKERLIERDRAARLHGH